MRRLSRRSAVLVLALGVLAAGCGGGSSPTEPRNPTPRGNWAGTVTGTHAGLGISGTCTLEMALDASLNGTWWVDCPNGARSQGSTIGLSFSQFAVLTMVPTSHATACPWIGVSNVLPTTLEGDFDVPDCRSNNNEVLSTGTFRMTRR